MLPEADSEQHEEYEEDLDWVIPSDSDDEVGTREEAATDRKLPESVNDSTDNTNIADFQAKRTAFQELLCLAGVMPHSLWSHFAPKLLLPQPPAPLDRASVIGLTYEQQRDAFVDLVATLIARDHSDIRAAKRAAATLRHTITTLPTTSNPALSTLQGAEQQKGQLPGAYAARVIADLRRDLAAPHDCAKEQIDALDRCLNALRGSARDEVVRWMRRALLPPKGPSTVKK